MHTHASNYELVEPLPEPERTLNRRLRRQIGKSHSNEETKDMNNPESSTFRFLTLTISVTFLISLKTTIPWMMNLCGLPTVLSLRIPLVVFFLYKTPNQAYQLLEDKVLLKLDWAKKKPKSSLKKTVAFADKGLSNSDTNKIMTRMDALTMKMDAQYKVIKFRSNHSIPEYDEDDKPMSPKAEAKFMQTFRHTRVYNGYRDSNRDN
nr:reverse transcriptase domain-containing protein [Tanacetum cinerariifolium]